MTISRIARGLCAGGLFVAWFESNLHHIVAVSASTTAAALVEGTSSRGSSPEGCVGDCQGDGAITIDELIWGVNAALALLPLDDCPAFDSDGDGRVGIDELVRAVNGALNGCSSFGPTATPTGTATPFTTTPTPPSTRRPNFILVNLDDTRADGIDRMSVLQSRIAGEGVLFTESFVPDAVCCPSRASILTGLYAFRHGTRAINGPIGGADTFRESGADQQTIAVWLQAAGYQTGLFGKYLNDYSTTEQQKGPGGSFYIPPGWSRWRAFVSPEHYGGVFGTTYELVDEAGNRTVYEDHTSDREYSTDVTARELGEFIADAVHLGQPFLAVWTPYASHAETPGFVPAPAARHYDVFADFPIWRPVSWNEPDVTDKPRWVQFSPPDVFGGSFTDVIRFRAYESLLAVDEQLGLILQQLASLGVDQETVILVTSDNGAGWGEHRMWAQRKQCPFEECLRVPLVVRCPRCLPVAPATRDAPVLNIDVPVTIADLAGVEIPVATDGLSFKDWLTESIPTQWRRDFLIEHWRARRDDSLSYSGQVADEDQIRLYHGDPRAHPRASTIFEFDIDGVYSPGVVAVQIGADADETFANLGAAVVATVPNKVRIQRSGELIVTDRLPGSDSVYWWTEVDQHEVLQPAYTLPDYFGVRDVAAGYTYVEYETGEAELYDLRVDPFQLDNGADDPDYRAVREDLTQRLKELLSEP